MTIAALILGSFVNAYVYRTYMIDDGSNKKKKQSNKYSIIRGRSICPNCKHTLSSLDLIPIISWLFLRGKCRYCSKPISVQYPAIELLAVFLFLFSLYFWPFHLVGAGLFLLIVWLFILTILIALAVYDIKYLTLPNRMVYALLAFVSIDAICRGIFVNQGSNYLLNAAVGSIIGGGIFYLIFQLSSGKLIGGGDVKLGAVLGLLLGSGTDALLMIFISSLLGSLVSIPLLLNKKLKRNTLIPYGPFLITATIILFLFSASFKNWLRTKGLYL